MRKNAIRVSSSPLPSSSSSSSPSYGNSNISRGKLFAALIITTLLIVYLVTDYFNVGLKQSSSFLIVSSLYNVTSNSTKPFNNNNEQNLLENCKPVYAQNKQYTVKFDGIVYPQYVPVYSNKSINFKCLNKSSVTKKILLWNTFFGNRDYSYGLGKVKPFVNHNCLVTNCELTDNKSELAESDLVIVHMRDLISNLPTESRPFKQRWV